MTKRDNVSWRPRVTASSRSFAGHRAQVSWMNEDFPQGGSLDAKAETRPPCPGGAPYSSRGQRPREGAAFVPRPCKGRIPVASRRSCVPQVRLIRPFQGRASWGGRVFRGRCPRLLYQSPAGILRIPRPPISSEKCGTCSGSWQGGERESRSGGRSCTVPGNLRSANLFRKPQTLWRTRPCATRSSMTHCRQECLTLTLLASCG
jgi:hypothetical protein